MPTSDFQGTIWRNIPRELHPLDVGWILRARGRWNRAGEYGCLYASLTREGSKAEYLKSLRAMGIHPSADIERDLVSIRASLEPVLDLTNQKVRRRLARRLGLSAAISKETLTADTTEALRLCRAIADLARVDGFVAILSLSAAKRGEHNLNIFVDVGPARQVQLQAGGDRQPLNY